MSDRFRAKTIAGGFMGAAALALSVTAVLVWGGQGTGGAAQAPPAPVNDTRTTPAEFEQWMKQHSNWGRWGKDDELGAVNLITQDKRKQAAALVRSGRVVSLAHDLVTDKAVDAPTPYALMPRIADQPQYAFDAQNIDYHGFITSHLDALCHVGYQGQLYNGRDFKTVASATTGCSHLDVTRVKDRLVTRGVLLDIPRLKNVPYLEPGTHVYSEDIEAWEKKTGVRLAPGDAVFLRTGRWQRRAKVGPFRELAGYDASVAPLLRNRDVAVIGSDTIQDVGTLPGIQLPIHKFAIVALGANLMDNLDLEALAEVAAAENRWEFMVVISPMPVKSGTGSAVNPLAIF